MIYLYAKQHRVTGLRYFGKTTRDPHKYLGSGLYWRKHIKKHGRDVETTWVHAYEDIALCEQEALFFSAVYNIVESEEWANIKPENGRDGWPAGTPNPRSIPQSAALRAQKSAKLKGHPGNPGEKNGRFGKPMSDEAKEKLRLTRKLNPTVVSWSEERRAKIAATWAAKTSTK